MMDITPLEQAFNEKGLRDSSRRPFGGAEHGARTRDLNLGKVALYQLS